MYEIFEKLLDVHKMTIYKFCKETGVSESTIYTWKKKHTQCNAKLQKIVCDYFKVSADYLMNGENYESETPYYINDDAREMAQFMFENPEYKVLFDASRKISKSDIETVKAIMDKFRSAEFD